MKKFLLPVCFIAIFSNCTNEVSLSDNQTDMSTKNDVMDTSNIVSLTDIQTLIKAKNNTTRNAACQEKDVQCLEDEEHDTLLYACDEPNGGWTIYSTDKRVPAIVAQSRSGSFQEYMKNETMALWIEHMANDMKRIKQTDDKNLSLSEQEIKQNKEYWESICQIEKYLNKNGKTRGPIIDPSNPIPATGHYELTSSYTTEEVYDSIVHLIPVHWHQNTPFNTYCPYNSTWTKKAYAGCVAIAGAQMLYYLHETLGVPTEAPSTASCSGNINNYSMEQGNFNSTVWNNMRYNDSYAAPLIANVGLLVNTDYGDEGSGANTEDLVNHVFANYGISCTYGNYNAETIKSNLLSNLPVIVRADGTKHHILFIVPQFSDGHAFIIDGYKRSRTATHNTYTWVYDAPVNPNVPRPEIPQTSSTTYTSPSITLFKMNWGWGNSYDYDNVWFAPTGDWIRVVDEDNGDELNFEYNRHMIYNFHIAD